MLLGGCCNICRVGIYIFFVCSPIDQEEKEAVRNHLLAGLEEPVNQVRYALRTIHDHVK